METLIDQFKSYPTWKKALIIVGLPVVLLLLFVRGASTIASLLNSVSRERTDAKSNALDQKIAETQSQIDQEKGKVDQLEVDKDEAKKSQETTDPVAFYNDRFKPDGK